MQRFRGGLVFKAHGLVYQSNLDLRVMKKKIKRRNRVQGLAPAGGFSGFEDTLSRKGCLGNRFEPLGDWLEIEQG